MRYHFKSVSCALISVGLLCSTSVFAAQAVLRVTGWDVYADPANQNKTIGYQSFERTHNVSIDFKPLSNLDQIVEAAESSDNYDVFIISNEGIELLHDMDLVDALELDKIPHYNSLHHSLNHTEWGLFDSQVYAVPWAWGPTGLLYDSEVISAPDSWNILWDPKYKGRVSLWDDMSMIWTTALALGYKNVYTLTRGQLKKVEAKLLELNNQVYDYYEGGNEVIDYPLKHNVVALDSWYDPSARINKQGRKFKMVIPKEGAVGMFDSYLLSKKSKNKDLAYKYMNHQISPAVQQQMVRVTGLAPANIETLTKLNEEEIKALHLDETDYFSKMLLWDHMPRQNLYEQVLKTVREDLAKRKTQ